MLENWSSLEGDGRLEGKGLHVMNLLLLLLPGKFRIVKMWSKNSCKNLSFDVRHWSHSAAVTESIFLIHNCDCDLNVLCCVYTFHISYIVVLHISTTEENLLNGSLVDGRNC